MEFHLSFCPYQRAFTPPLRTARGEWSVRAGFIVRVEGTLGVGYGEVAPIPEFGTETVEAAQAYLSQVAGNVVESEALMIPETLPCCAFGISSALLATKRPPRRDYAVAALLPAGRDVLKVAQAKVVDGYTSFKWKIGVEPPAVEQALLADLFKLLPNAAQLRLDANGGLTEESLKQWLKLLQKYSQQIDYLEQPLPVGQEAMMARYASEFQAPIALDESLHGSAADSWLKPGAWPGPLVIKPSLMGDCRTLIQRLRPVATQVVFSSVFETAIGLENTLHIADQLSELYRPIGFDTLAAFPDSLSILKPAPVIKMHGREKLDFSTVWNRLDV